MERVIEIITITPEQTYTTTIRYNPDIDGDIWQLCHRVHKQYRGATAYRYAD